MRDEISAGLKIAIERGASLEEAAQTFINAGYNPVEVREAANTLGPGITSQVTQQNFQVQTPVQAQPPISQAQAQQTFMPPSSPSTTQTYKKSFSSQGQQDIGSKSKRMQIIILCITLLLLVGALIFVLIFYEQLIELVQRI